MAQVLIDKFKYVNSNNTEYKFTMKAELIGGRTDLIIIHFTLKDILDCI